MSEQHDAQAWQTLGAHSPDALLDARLQLHWATQIVAAVPFTYLDAVPDFSHINLGWNPESGVLSSRPVGKAPERQLGLRFLDLTLVLQDRSGEILEEYGLPGCTLEQGLLWAAEALTQQVPDQPVTTLERPEGDLPHHPVADGAAFSAPDGQAFTELARWYSNALLAFSEVVQYTPGASEVRCWPHHFDLATLITVKAAQDSEQMQSVGVGMTPGDEHYAEPYFYVTPWPYPKDPILPALAGEGTWHTHGWTGAVLTGSRLIAGAASAEAQGVRAREFLRSAVPAARALVGG